MRQRLGKYIGGGVGTGHQVPPGAFHAQQAGPAGRRVGTDPADLDENLSWLDVFGLALLGGIGFTVSLLIGELAYGEGSIRDDRAKVAVLAAPCSPPASPHSCCAPVPTPVAGSTPCAVRVRTGFRLYLWVERSVLEWRLATKSSATLIWARRAASFSSARTIQVWRVLRSSRRRS